MYTIAKELGVRTLLLKEAPFLLIAFMIAEMFYKWHSFTLEMIGFLVTWSVLSFIGNTIMDRVLPSEKATVQPQE